jgi:hypothetical protein
MAGEKETIAQTDILREKGFLYVCGTDDKGCVTIIKLKAGRKAKNKDEVKN